MGMTTRLTPVLIERLEILIQVTGAQPYICAQAIGIPTSTYYGWLEHAAEDATRDVAVDAGAHSRAQLLTLAAKAGITRRHSMTKKQLASALEDAGTHDSPYLELSERVKKAEANVETVLADEVLWMARAAGDWRGVMTFLERRFPERWSRRERLALEMTSSEFVDPELAIAEGRARLRVIEGDKS